MSKWSQDLLILMHALTDSEFRRQAEPILKQVFADGWDSTDGFGEIFVPQITSRIILFPCEQEGFRDCLSSQVLVDAALKTGDTGCYIFPWWNGSSDYCYVPLSEFVEGYDGKPGSSNLIGAKIGINLYSPVTTIVSSQGKWGLYTSSEHHALLGGSPEFMEEIRRGMPHIDNQVYEFFDFWHTHRQSNLDRGFDYGSPKWYKVLLNHIYGLEKGDRLLQESGLLWENSDESIEHRSSTDSLWARDAVF